MSIIYNFWGDKRKGITGSKSIKIEAINYFGEDIFSNGNGRTIYKKNGKTYIAVINIDFFNERIHVPLKQPKGSKALVGLEQELNKQYEYYF